MSSYSYGSKLSLVVNILDFVHAENDFTQLTMYLGEETSKM